MAQKVALDSIRSLTFYKGEYTKARRTTPIQQLTCVGRPCNLYQPDVVRCVNEGGRGLDVEWKCEADLPEQLRFGRVDVSCEGWSKPGDPNVLKGSCGLEYRLLRVPGVLNNDNVREPGFLHKILPKDPYETVFMLVWCLLLLFILYHFLKAWFTSRNNQPRTNHARGRPTGPGGGGGGGWFSGNRPDENDPPPPYSGPYKRASSEPGSGWAWRPGFWTGLGLGGLAANMYARRNQPEAYVPPPRRSFWDWERPAGSWWQGATPRQAAAAPESSGGLFARRTTPAARTSSWSSNNDRGEGSSNLGRMRTSTGYGGSSVR